MGKEKISWGKREVRHVSTNMGAVGERGQVLSHHLGREKKGEKRGGGKKKRNIILVKTNEGYCSQGTTE